MDSGNIVLTDEQKLRIAEEADKLAAKIRETNKAPAELTSILWCGCGMGHVLQAAGFIPDGGALAGMGPPNIGNGAFNRLASGLDQDLKWAVSNATELADVSGDATQLPPALTLLSKKLREEVKAAQ